MPFYEDDEQENEKPKVSPLDRIRMQVAKSLAGPTPTLGQVYDKATNLSPEDKEVAKELPTAFMGSIAPVGKISSAPAALGEGSMLGKELEFQQIKRLLGGGAKKVAAPVEENVLRYPMQQAEKVVPSVEPTVLNYKQLQKEFIKKNKR